MPTRPARSRRISLAEEIKGIVDSYRANNPNLQVRRHRRRRFGDPVLPLPRPEPARPGIGLRAAGRQQLGVRGEPAPRLRAGPGCIRRGHAGVAAHEQLPGARTRRRPPGRDRRRKSPGSSTPTSKRAGSSSRRSSLVTGYDFLDRRGERRADGTAEGHRRALRHADRAEQPVARGPAVLEGLRPRRQAARQPPRHHVPGRALQRQQRARGRLQDQPADDRPRRVVGRT